MYVLNKVVGGLCDPVNVAAVGALLALLLRLAGRRRAAGGLLVLCAVWAWLWAMPLMGRIVGVTLEGPYLVGGRVPSVQSYQVADVIELHGGSMSDDSGLGGRGEMWTSADRVWMAARLWKAGKAPKIYVTGGGVKTSTVGLLEDFGIPTNAIILAESPRNTEEEARFIANAMNQVKVKGQGQQWNSCTRPRVLVVTSAWHMKRTMMLYDKYAPNVEAIPAPCDFENTLKASESALSFVDFIPKDETLLANRIALHEWVGILGYRIKWMVVRK